MRDRRVSRHVPEMVWYSDPQLVQMLQKWRLVYVKPDRGSGGTGVIRVARRNAGYVVSWGYRKVVCEAKRLPAVVKAAMLRGKRYVIQRGIRMAKVNGKPFDLRVVWQKPGKNWQLTWMSAKIATRRGATVTNVAKGGVDARIRPTLIRMTPPVQVEDQLTKIRTVSRKLVQVLGERFPFRIIGLDLAIDQQRRIWFIEANTNPNFKGLRKLDPVQYERYLRAQQIIRGQSRGEKRSLQSSAHKQFADMLPPPQ